MARQTVTTTPTVVSPWNFFQERYRSDPWKLLVCTMLLNQTPGRQVEKVHVDFFRRWPTPEVASAADPHEMALMLRPLGFQNRRSTNIIRMSSAYRGKWTRPEELPGIGKYGADSYRIFVDGVLVEPDDKELKRYVDWARTR